MPICTNTTDPYKLLQHTRASVIKHSLYSTTWIYWAVFKQKYDVRVIERYTVHLRIIYNGHNARLMHDHVTVIIFTLITIVVHQNFRLLVWHWLLLSSENCSLRIMCSYRVFEPPFSLYSQRHEKRFAAPKHRICREVVLLFIYRLYIFLHDLTG